VGSFSHPDPSESSLTDAFHAQGSTHRAHHNDEICVRPKNDPLKYQANHRTNDRSNKQTRQQNTNANATLMPDAMFPSAGGLTTSAEPMLATPANDGQSGQGQLQHHDSDQTRTAKHVTEKCKTRVGRRALRVGNTRRQRELASNIEQKRSKHSQETKNPRFATHLPKNPQSLHRDAKAAANTSVSKKRRAKGTNRRSVPQTFPVVAKQPLLVCFINNIIGHRLCISATKTNQNPTNTKGMLM
jgi:hypothetical protein